MRIPDMQVGHHLNFQSPIVSGSLARMVVIRPPRFCVPAIPSAGHYVRHNNNTYLDIDSDMPVSPAVACFVGRRYTLQFPWSRGLPTGSGAIVGA